jgi:aryl-alcohol dehydrogenase-like predicted oxidoreductase
VIEGIVGKTLKGRRDNVVLATKVHIPRGDDPNQRGNSRRWLTRGVEDSLCRMQTDHIDLYQVRRPSPDTDIEEALSALTDLMRAGKVRATRNWVNAMSSEPVVRHGRTCPGNLSLLFLAQHLRRGCPRHRRAKRRRSSNGYARA